MAGVTKFWIVLIGVILFPFICYFGYFFLKDYYQMKNVIHVTFKKSKGKTKGYVKDKKGNWKHDEDLQLEDDIDLKDED
jgi:hypothetical protein